MKTPTYPLNAATIPTHTDGYRSITFLKQIKITQGDTKQGILEFSHLGQSFRLGGEFLDDLIGFEVLVDAAFNVTMDGVNLGRATHL